MELIGRIDWKEVFERSKHWSVQVAKQGIERFLKYKSEGKIKSDFITVRCASTPTGVYHIGHLNEIVRSYFIAKAIEMLGYKARVVFTIDDRDPQRGFPAIIVDKDGYMIEFPEEIRKEFEEKYDGFPVCNIPDPLKCHTTWTEHFLSVFLNEIKRLGISDNIRLEVYSPDQLYRTGEWDEGVKLTLENKEKIKEIYRDFKQHIREYAFSVICERCGRIGTTIVSEYDKEKEQVRYVCGGRHLKKKTVEGCGYEGYTGIRNGKIDWYVEWAWNWKYFETIIEPMGKDHWVSSWKISPKFAREVFNWEEPIPLFYDYFTIDGKKMSSSKGNVYSTTEILRISEPEILIYFYTKRPDTERDISLENFHLLVDEYDRFEEKVYKTLELLERGEIKIDDLLDHKKVSEIDLAEIDDLVVYYLSNHGKIKEKRPFRLPYYFAAIIGQVVIPRKYLERTDLPFYSVFDEDIDEILERIKNIVKNSYGIDIRGNELMRTFERCRKAGFWGIRYASDIYRISIVEGRVEIELSDNEREVIRNIMEVVKSSKYDYNELQTKIHSIIKEKTDPKNFYKKLYKIFIGKENGPKIASIILSIGKEKAIEILERYI
ncbi:MAG: lysine--tRNA ligase [Candidatus Nanoclepta minutus]|uniref:Lysine--tRNA ligase n=1 Tax=Candidatus Nanoclepta minutus TaxID=1940235 RepID=A0A397WNB3_9ARCH|nr:MAG: lysine--tRNA ligase [Candidatus Nanoclepta minutus]